MTARSRRAFLVECATLPLAGLAARDAVASCAPLHARPPAPSCLPATTAPFTSRDGWIVTLADLDALTGVDGARIGRR